MTVEFFLLVGSILLFISILAEKTGYRFGVPTLLLFLVIGMMAGTDGVGIEFNNPFFAQSIGVVALNLILFSGGMSTKYHEVRPIIAQGVVLSTLGVFLTAIITAGFIYWLTQKAFSSITFSFLEALLLASVMASTDSASVFGILRSKSLDLKERLRPMLEFESGSNDPMAYLMTISMISFLTNPETSIWSMLLKFVAQFSIGALAGYFLGKIFLRLFNRINLENDSLYSVLMIAGMFFVFSFTNFIQGNGYLSVYIAGLVIGNNKFVHKRSVVRFFDGLAWLFQIVMFLTLGLLVNPLELIPVAGIGLLIGIFMIFAGRPLAVFTSLLPFRKMSLKAKTYVSWVGLRGAVPIIFATYPWLADIPQAKMIFNIVFFITILSLVLQGTTVSSMAQWFGLSRKQTDKMKLQEFDIEFSDDIKSAMTEFVISENNLKNGNKMMDIPLPENTLVVMVKRNEHYFGPRGNTELAEGDILLLISDDEKLLQETYERLGKQQ